jgi:hypothetical protein
MDFKCDKELNFWVSNGLCFQQYDGVVNLCRGMVR